MKKTLLFLFILLTVILEIIITIACLKDETTYKNDTIKLNELVREIEGNYGNENKYPKDIDYTILDNDEKVVYKTSNETSKSLNEAYQNKDTIIDFYYNNGNKGKIIINNNEEANVLRRKNNYIKAISLIAIIQFVAFIVYYIYLYKNIIKPFKKMKDFATRITNGNLDIPLKMDKYNNFGAFTEAFDLMRYEISKSRLAEKEAVEAKKELVAKLSHDIKTPISSIKSYSELGLAISNEEKSKEYFKSINHKSDQMSAMITNLFNSTLEELEELKINSVDIKSSVVETLIKNADYLEKSKSFTIPNCNIYADKLRLQQIFDNIFINSYKYANTEIEVNSYIKDEYLIISIRDFGKNLNNEEIPLLTEKFKRGSNIDNIEGTGLGLYISKELLKKMNGDLELSSSNPGFNVLIYLRIK